MHNPLSLLELNQLIKQSLDSNLAPSYWVIAEIGEFRDSVKGHAYLELVEKSGNQIVAKLRANIWSYTYQGIRTRFIAATGRAIENGMKVLALVNVQYHEIYGLSANIKEIDPNYTIGERARIKQEIIERLTREGLMQLNKQFILPSVPQKIAVISSSTAAGFGDFVNQLEHNHAGYKVHWELFQASMQGNEAVRSIIQSIENIESENTSKHFDLIVLIRGGGAQTDLDCFDDYDLARTISNASLPVITGIGHERDESIADMVANTRLKTPTAVAEFILSGFRTFEEALEEKIRRMERVIGFVLQKEDKIIHDLEYLLQNLFTNKLKAGHEILENKKNRILSIAIHKIRIHDMRLENNHKSLLKVTGQTLEKARQKITVLEKELTHLNPRYFLEKGYTRSEINGKPVHRQKIHHKDTLITYTLDKKIKSEVKTVENYGG